MQNVDQIKNLTAHLEKHIRGQSHVIAKVCSVVERAEFELGPPEKPKGTLLFLGPTGVGKTELTLELARYLYKSEESVFRFDMSEFFHEDSVKLFTGDESGRTGRLGKVLESHSQGILLFDEFEKAHRLIWDLFLQMTDSARVTLSNHQTYDLSGFYLVFTSNIGSQNLLRNTRLPFATLQRAVLAELSRLLRPELIARFDETLVFRPLSYEIQREIALLTIVAELARLETRGIQVTVADETIEFLIRHGIHKTLGARNMKKVVRTFLGDSVAALFKRGILPPIVGVVKPASDSQSLWIQI